MEHIAQTSAFTDISRFTALRAAARRDGDAAFAAVAKEFEALFIQQMLKAAREASTDGGLFNSRELKLYREMMDSQVALAMADQGGIGFADVLGAQFGVDSASDPEATLKLPEPAFFQPQLRLNAAPRETPKAATEGRVNAKLNISTNIDFIEALSPLARRAATKLGLEPEILVAQAALETGWGRHVIADPDGNSSNNFFAIKASANWEGERIDVQTLEYVGGRPMQLIASFRAYPDMGAAFDDYVAFLEHQPRYASALEHGGNPRDFIVGLQDAGYATDPRYAEKTLAIKDQITARSTLTQR